MADFSTTPDYFDSREVIERIAELELEYGPEDGDSIDTIHTEKMSEDEQEEYAALLALAEQTENDVADWQYGETFIHEDYFEDYAEEFIVDCGYIPADLPSWIVIDWKETADNLKEDYTEYTFRGETYYAR